MTVVAYVEAALVTVPDAVGIAPRTVVALPPSDADDPGVMRAAIGGVLIDRQYDIEMSQP